MDNGVCNPRDEEKSARSSENKSRSDFHSSHIASFVTSYFKNKAPTLEVCSEKLQGRNWSG